MVEEVLESAVDESGSEQALPSEEVLVVTEISEETNGDDMNVLCSEEEANGDDMKVGLWMASGGDKVVALVVQEFSS